MSREDKKSVGLTLENQRALAEIEAKAWFSEAQEAARFCMAYAIRAGVAEGITTGTDTRWHAGNFDDSGEIRSLLGVLYPACKTPVLLMEHFVNEGIRLLAERVKSESSVPSDLFQ